MADIKVKESKKGKIKTINKAVVGTQKIKNNVFDRNNQITEPNTKEENISATEYAIEKSKNAIKHTFTGMKALITAIIAGGWVIIIIIVLLLSITALLYNSSENNDIVTVALSQVGNVGGEPYWSWYGFKERVEWCACFVSFCANECGYIEKGIIPKFAGCELEGVSWFKSHNLWIEGEAIPQPGYIVFFDWKDKHDGKADHVRNCAEI